ncbi:MAG: hypothetical protein WC783_00120 [Candidatus Paceibacterota bacterium]|jgi:hypothetical protein
MLNAAQKKEIISQLETGSLEVMTQVLDLINTLEKDFKLSAEEFNWMQDQFANFIVTNVVKKLR